MTSGDRSNATARPTRAGRAAPGGKPAAADDDEAAAGRLAALAGEILRLCGEARRLTSEAIDRDREAGEACLKARAACKDRGVPWRPWCERHLGPIGGLRTVQRLMKLVKNWKAVERQRTRTPDLTTTAALRLLKTARGTGRKEGPGSRPADQLPRLTVSGARCGRLAVALGLDPKVALSYLRLMVSTAGYMMTVLDD